MTVQVVRRLPSHKEGRASTAPRARQQRRRRLCLCGCPAPPPGRTVARLLLPPLPLLPCTLLLALLAALLALLLRWRRMLLLPREAPNLFAARLLEGCVQP